MCAQTQRREFLRQNPRKEMGYPGLEETRLAAVGVLEGYRFRVKRQPARAGILAAVFLVADNGEIVFRQMNADLMLAACQQVDVE